MTTSTTSKINSLGWQLRLVGYALLLLVTFPVALRAQYTTTSDGNGGLIVTGYQGTPPNQLAIPGTINNLTVTSIGSTAFAYDTGVTSVTIPSSVTSIASFAFAYCGSITSVTIPSSVTSLGYGAFQNCYTLSSVVFVGNAPTMGGLVFTGNLSNLTVYYANGATGFTSPTWNPDANDTYSAAINPISGTVVGTNLYYSSWFGYYTATAYPFVYEYNLGYEYVFPTNNGVYLYDYTSGHFWYTQSSYFPFIYDFTLNAYLYYYQANTPHRHFYDYGTETVITE